MTIKEIARQLDMSPATVSICLAHKESDKRYCIKPEKAEKVREFARSAGYFPNHAARRLRSKSLKPPIGLLFSRNSGMEKYFPVLSDIMALLEKQGREFVTMTYETGRMSNAIAIMKSMGAKHIVVLGYITEPSAAQVFQVHADWEMIKNLSLETNIYFTDYGFPAPQEKIPSVFRFGINRREMISAIISRVTAAGKGPVALSSWGVHSQMLPPEIIPDSELIIPLDITLNRFADGEAFAVKAAELRRKKFFRTVLIGSDEAAAGAIAKFQELGIRVPEDLGIIGFGNSDTAPYFRIPLTSVGYSIRKNILSLIESIIAEKEVKKEQILDYCLVIRESFKFDTEQQINS